MNVFKIRQYPIYDEVRYIEGSVKYYICQNPNFIHLCEEGQVYLVKLNEVESIRSPEGLTEFFENTKREILEVPNEETEKLFNKITKLQRI